MATENCSNQIYKAYVDFNLKYAVTSAPKDTKYMETICLHIVDTTLTKSIVSEIITPQNTTVVLIDAPESFPLMLQTELNRIVAQFTSYGGLRMFFLLTPTDNVITIPDPEIDTLLDVVGYVKQHANSLATVATLMHFTETFDEFAVLYEKTQDKLATNPSKNVCLFYDVDIGFMNDYLQFLSLTYSKTGDEFLTQMIIGRRHTIENHENIISSAEESATMRRSFLSFLSCDGNGGFVGYFTSGAMNNTACFWTAQVRYDLQYYIMEMIKRGIPYNALSIKDKVSVGNNCLKRIYDILLRVLSKYKNKGVILELYQAKVPDQTWEARNTGDVYNVQVVYAPMNTMVAVNGEISTDVQSAVINSGLASTPATTSTKLLFPKKEGATYQSWGLMIETKDVSTPDAANLISLINNEV